MAKSNKLKELLARLPEDQRERAHTMIEYSRTMGWTDQELWCDDGCKPHWRDLVGRNPKGDFDFLPDLPDEAAT